MGVYVFFVLAVFAALRVYIVCCFFFLLFVMFAYLLMQIVIITCLYYYVNKAFCYDLARSLGQVGLIINGLRFHSQEIGFQNHDVLSRQCTTRRNRRGNGLRVRVQQCNTSPTRCVLMVHSK